MDIRKRKRILKPTLSSLSHTKNSSTRSLVLCFSFFIFLLFLANHFRIQSAGFHPIRIVPSLSALSSSVSNSIQDLATARLLPDLRVEGRVLFPDSVLLILALDGRHNLREDIDCVYHKRNGSSGSNGVKGARIRPILSIDEYGELPWIVRCPLPPRNYSRVVGLSWRRSQSENRTLPPEVRNLSIPSWDMVAYEAELDGEEADTAAVFVKGLNLRPDKESDPSQFSCHFKTENFQLTTKAITAAQEVVRCPLPSDLNLGKEKDGVSVTIGITSRRKLVPSVAKLRPRNTRRKNGDKYELCACTMVWNQASTIKEWIIYHAWLGIDRWFIYDNNSDDDLKEVIQELGKGNYNISRHAWPWIKTQEAGFSHCALRAREECSWVAFFDVDEFFYFPPSKHRGIGNNPGENSLRDLVANASSSSITGELRTSCHSFGPSGLRTLPEEGVTLGYTCRLQSPERHKSIVRPDAVHENLLNHVHHFRLREGFRYLNLPQGTLVINHYKYQVWEAFKAKFYRRVSTYVADWQQNQNEGSRDRAPGLGTEAIEPPDWRLRFCEVWDTGLRDFVVANMADPVTGLLPWARSDRR